MVGKNVWIYLENCIFLEIKAISWPPRVCIKKKASRVWSTNAGIYKIDGPTLKLFSRVQVEDKFKEACLFFKETFLAID